MVAYNGAQLAGMLPVGGYSQAALVTNFNGPDNSPTSAVPITSWRNGGTPDVTAQVAPAQNSVLKATM